jgi:hypothetical protein
MARAAAIWVVTDAQRTPVACFTVKHECVRWLLNTDKDTAWVARYPDGSFLETLPVWAVADFLKEAGK